MENKYELIIVISNQGYIDEVMRSAKKVGARGGTIISGKGTADAETIKLFGFKIQPFKEILMIVTDIDDKEKIISTITEKHGSHTEARALCFTLLIDDVRGFTF